MKEHRLIIDHTDPIFRALVKKDLGQTIRANQLDIERDIYEPLLVQSVVGHAQNGHKEFYIEYPNATITDIILAADLNEQKIKGTRQRLIDDYIDWLELIKQDKTDRLSVHSRPLFGFLPFNNSEYTVIPEAVIKGTILCGLMDNNEWRMKTLDRFDQVAINGGLLTIGYGESYLFNLENLSELGIGIEDLAKEAVTDKTIEYFKKEGVITTSDDPLAKVVFVRKGIGAGTSDDCSFIMAGNLYHSNEKASQSAFLAGFCIDAVDTYDKCVSHPIQGGYDEMIAKGLKKEFPDLVSDDEITDLIYYVSRDNGKKLVSSSHKRLVQRITNLHPIKPTIIYHLNFLLTGKRQKDFRVGFDQMPSQVFYNEVTNRLNHYNNKEK